MTVEQVLQFLNSKDTMYKLAEFVDKKLKGMNLPKTMSAYENDDMMSWQTRYKNMVLLSSVISGIVIAVMMCGLWDITPTQESC